MELASPSELRDRTRTRDAQDVRTYEVRFTNVDAFLDDLKADAKSGAIEAGIVRLAVVNFPASDQNVSDAFGDGFNPHGDRHNHLYRTKAVQASYLCRGQLVKLTAECGIALADNVAERFGQQYADAGIERTRQCAERVQEVSQKLLKAVDGIDGLDVRGGGLFVEDGPWRGDADHAIEALPQERCATCQCVIYYSNHAWRSKETRRAEHLVDGRGLRGQPMKRIDHYHDPVIKDLQVPGD